ncbi:helix-turn-helix domain-containing protein [Streptomyces sp. NPDC002911]
MTPEGTPTARRQRLGTELRRLRESTGLSATQRARLLGVSQAQFSNIEASRFGVSPERLHAMARNYRCSDHVYIRDRPGVLPYGHRASGQPPPSTSGGPQPPFSTALPSCHS